MYPLILHRNLAAERWHRLSTAQQVLMIANELHRAGNWIAKGAPDEVNACYERAFELCDLTGEDRRWRRNARRELRRFRELLASLYLSEKKEYRANEQLYRGLIQLDPEAWNLVKED